MENSYKGMMTITKISDNIGYFKNGDSFTGYTNSFKEGYSLVLDNGYQYYITSNIVKIDFENNRFFTLNSTYSFKYEN